MRRRRFRVLGAEHEVEARFADGRLVFTATDGEHHELEAVAVAAGAWLLRAADGRTETLWLARRRQTWWVHYRGRTFALEQLGRGPGHPEETGSLTAPMTGTIERLFVEEGQEVARGEVLLSIAAMKMQIEVRAPHDGTVAKLLHGAGEQVQGGAVVAVIEAPNAGGAGGGEAAEVGAGAASRPPADEA